MRGGLVAALTGVGAKVAKGYRQPSRPVVLSCWLVPGDTLEDRDGQERTHSLSSLLILVDHWRPEAGGGWTAIEHPCTWDGAGAPYLVGFGIRPELMRYGDYAVLGDKPIKGPVCALGGIIWHFSDAAVEHGIETPHGSPGGYRGDGKGAGRNLQGCGLRQEVRLEP
jgi:hypothetical protein